MVGEPDRHGSSPRPFADLEEYLRFLAGLKCLCLPDGNGEYRVVGLPFTEYLRQRPLDKGIRRHTKSFCSTSTIFGRVPDPVRGSER
jgi:hypothetical protein